MWKWAFAAFAVVLLAPQGLVADEEEEGQDCVCVPYYLCNDGSINDDGSTIITIRMRECDNYLDVCCEVTPSHVLPAPEVPSATLPAPAPGNVVCGHRNIGGVSDASDVRGDEAHFGEFPWMVAVLEVEATDSSTRGGSLNLYRCGGSLIHPKVVLTAAHCVAGKENSNLKIRAGEWDTQSNDEPHGKQDRDVERFVVHEQFGRANLFNDVALLFLSEPIEAAEHIGFACLPPQGYLPANGTRCLASGWGKDKSGGVHKTILNKVDLPVVANPECQAALRQSIVGSYFRLHPSFMCAGGEGERDTCEGDGGSPLVCPLPDNPDIYIQSGVVAWGIRCGIDKLPGVYASVAFFRNWIDHQMQEAQLSTSTYSF